MPAEASSDLIETMRRIQAEADRMQHLLRADRGRMGLTGWTAFVRIGHEAGDALVRAETVQRQHDS